MIPTRINSEDQKEVLRLLCKVHELELTNTEVQSSCILRDFQIKKKDMVISRYRQHQSLCDQIIHKQKKILDGKKSSLCLQLPRQTNGMINMLICSEKTTVVRNFAGKSDKY